MRILMQLDGGCEIDGCDCAVVEVDVVCLERFADMAHQLLAVHKNHADVYKIEFWGNSMEVYSYELVFAVEADHVLPSGYKHFVLPAEFEIPAGCEEQRLECRTTAAIQPDDWSSRDSVDLQFSAAVKHTSVTLNTHPINLGDLKSLLSD